MTSHDSLHRHPQSLPPRPARRQAALIGCWCRWRNPITTEVLGLAGFDWLLLDGEHAPNDVRHLHPAADGAEGQSQRAGRAAAVERRGRHQAPARRRVLQLPDPVRRVRGRGARAPSRRPAIRRPASAASRCAQRSNRYGTVPDYLATVNDNICVLVQIESGPGARRDRRHRRGRRRRRHLRRPVGPRGRASATWATPPIPTCSRRSATSSRGARAQGKPSGILAPVEADARRYLEWGASFVAVGSDLGALPRRHPGAARQVRGGLTARPSRHHRQFLTGAAQ